MDGEVTTADDITKRLFDYWTGGAAEDHVHLTVRRCAKGIEVQLADKRSVWCPTLTTALFDLHGKFVDQAGKELERIEKLGVKMASQYRRLIS